MKSTAKSKQSGAGPSDWLGFWSYVHVDDKAEGGRIRRLAEDLTAQFEMLSGEPLHLFLDRDAIKWGETWRNKIEDALASIAFFVPVMTPRYFLSPECRGELQSFIRKADKMGIKDLILPLLYVDVPALDEETPADDLVAMIRTFQWEDWRELKFAEPTSEPYRRAVTRLASRLLTANRNIERADASLPAIDNAPLGDSAPGLLDIIGTAEVTLPKIKSTIEEMGTYIEQVGKIMTEATEQTKVSDKHGKGMAGRLQVVRHVSRQLSEPAESVWRLGNEFASQLHDCDGGIRAIIELSEEEVARDPSAKPTLCEFFLIIRQFGETSRSSLATAQQMIDSFAPMEAMSRDLRPPLRRLRQGLTVMIEAREVIDGWVRLVDASRVPCD